MEKRILSVVLVLCMMLSITIAQGSVFAEVAGEASGEVSEVPEAAEGLLLSQVHIIHFYDWDGTYLGDKLFWAVGGKEGASRAVNEFSQENYAGVYTINNSAHDNRYVEDASKPLTHKKGYNFGGWVEVTPETLDSTFTAYANEEEINEDIKDFQKHSLNFSNHVAYVKAAYVGNETLDTEAWGVSAKYYTYSDFAYEKICSQVYAVEFTLKRENSKGRGVTRLKDPIIRVTLISEDKKFFIKHQLENKDEQRVRLEIPSECDEFSIVLHDNGKGIHYTSTDPASNEGTLYPKNASFDKDINGEGYKVEGALTELNNKLELAFSLIKDGIKPNIWILTIHQGAFEEMNLDDVVLAQSVGLEEPARAVLLGIARNKIMLYSAANGKRKLTWKEVEQAIQMETGVHLMNPVNTDFIAYMQPKIEAVYQESQENYGGAMTAQEVEAYINVNF